MSYEGKKCDGILHIVEHAQMECIPLTDKTAEIKTRFNKSSNNNPSFLKHKVHSACLTQTN